MKINLFDVVRFNTENEVEIINEVFKDYKQFYEPTFNTETWDYENNEVFSYENIFFVSELVEHYNGIQKPDEFVADIEKAESEIISYRRRKIIDEL